MISKDSLLDQTNRGLAIFQHYIPDLASQGPKRNFRAVFRDDGRNPDARVSFSDRHSMWYYHDFATGESLNPFDFVMKLRNCGFPQALDLISREVLNNLPPGGVDGCRAEKPKITWTLEDGGAYTYWYQFGPEAAITTAIERYHIKSLRSYTYEQEGKRKTIESKPDDPLFAFMLSDSCCKIYRPKANENHSKFRWFGKKPEEYHDLYGMDQLPEYAEYILIVEGLKDVIVANANGIPAVGVDNAATRIRAGDIQALKKKCPHLFVCYDIDKAGERASMKVAEEHQLRRLQLPASLSNEGGKDIADFFRLGHRADEISRLVSEAISTDLQGDSKASQQAAEGGDERLSLLEKIEQFIDRHYEFRYNEVSNMVEYRKIGTDGESYKDLNENNIYRFLQHHSISIPLYKLKALLGSDFVSPYNPFQNYFTQLPAWNPGIDPDHIDKLCSYIPADHEERFRRQFRKALVRTVACALDDTVINKQALILVNDEQNTGKSTFIRWLCPPLLQKYIAENISVDKDSLIALCDNFIINMDELATLSRAEINSLKSMFSKATIKIRRPYDRVATFTPRRASFFGSTNSSEFLTDETGSVRWLCFDLQGTIDWAYKKVVDINNVWAQAYRLFKDGFPYELTFDELQENSRANQQHQVTTPEMEMIQKYLLPGKKEDGDVFLQTTEIFEFLKGKHLETRISTTNIGKALKLFGFPRLSSRQDGYSHPIKGYYIKYKEEKNLTT